MKPEDQPYMGLAEVAAYLNITRAACSNRRRRGKLPKPLVVLALGPVWQTADIVQWAKELRT